VHRLDLGPVPYTDLHDFRFAFLRHQALRRVVGAIGAMAVKRGAVDFFAKAGQAC
jgi:hypothetical protein